MKFEFNERFEKAKKDTMPGCTQYTRKCQICNKYKNQSGGSVYKGKSRHDPTRFTCHDCLTED